MREEHCVEPHGHAHTFQHACLPVWVYGRGLGDTNTYATNERTTSEKILSQSWEASEPVSFSLHTSTQNSV